MNTRPSAAIGAIGMVMPGSLTRSRRSHTVWPSRIEREHMGVGCAAKELAVEIGESRCTAREEGDSSGRSTRHLSAHVDASTAYDRVSVVKYIVPLTTIGPVCRDDTSGSV